MNATLYKLRAHTHYFNGTDCDSGRGTIDIAISPTRSRVEEVKRYLESDVYDTIVEGYKNAQRKDWNTKIPKTIEFEASFGTVTVPVLLDDYYGNGCVSYYSVDEIGYLDPTTFL